MPSSMSVIIMIKSRGPRTEPCGTPDVTSTGSDKASSTLTSCFRHLRKDSSHLMSFPFMFSLRSFAIKMLWSTLSNAFLTGGLLERWDVGLLVCR